MRQMSESVYNFSIVEYKDSKTFSTEVKKPNRTVEQPSTEGCAAARKILNLSGHKKITLILKNNLESAFTLYSFLHAGAHFNVIEIAFEPSLQSAGNCWLRQSCQKANIEYRPLLFDFNDQEHILRIRHLSEQLKTYDLPILIDLWATCQVDEYPVLPGYFTFPLGDSATGGYTYNLPSLREKSYFDFFSQFEGTPFFLGSTSELVYSFAETTLALENRLLLQKGHAPFAFDFNTKYLLMQDCGFTTELRLPAAEDNTWDHFRVRAQGQTLMLISEFDHFARSQNQYTQYMQQLKWISDKQAVEVRADVLKKIKSGMHGAGLLLKTDEDRDLTEDSPVAEIALFPQLALVFQKHDLQAAHLQYLESLPYAANFLNYSSAKNLHEHAELADLIDFFQNSINSYMNKMGYIYNSVSITQCWANKNIKGSGHHLHSHSNSFISGVFYLTDDGGDIIFQNNTYRMLSPAVQKLNAYNSQDYYIPPLAGRLVIFPSHIAHAVQPNREEIIRYSISFNTMLKGPVGEWSHASWTEIL